MLHVIYNPSPPFPGGVSEQVREAARSFVRDQSPALWQDHLVDNFCCKDKEIGDRYDDHASSWELRVYDESMHVYVWVSRFIQLNQSCFSFSLCSPFTLSFLFALVSWGHCLDDTKPRSCFSSSPEPYHQLTSTYFVYAVSSGDSSVFFFIKWR